MKTAMKLFLILTVWCAAGARLGVLAAQPGSSPEADCPCWRGPNGNGALGDSGFELVDDAKDARLLWVSEEKGIGVAWGRYAGPQNYGRCVVRSSGYACLSVANGRAYFVHYVPHGTVVDDTMVATAAGDRRPSSWAINADDVLLCLDASNGRTLWKAVFPEKGLNHNNYREGTFLYACLADGKAFFIGTAGRVYAVDAATGRPLWESSVGKGAERCEVIRRDCLKNRKVLGRQDKPFDTSPVYACGVVVCSDSDRTFGGTVTADGLTGLDARTGKQLWNITNAVGPLSSPVPWVHKGMTNIVSASNQRLIAVDPGSGRVMWEVRRLFGNCTPAVCEEYVVMEGTGICKGSPPQLSDTDTGAICLRITPDKAETVWELPVEGRGFWNSPLIYRGYAYVSGKIVELATGKVIGKSPGDIGGVAGDGRAFFDSTAMFVVENGQLKPAGRLEARGKASGLEGYTPTTLAQGRLFYRGSAVDTDGNQENGCFYCFDLRKTPDTAVPQPVVPPDPDALAKNPAALLTTLHATYQCERDAAVTAAGRMDAAAKTKLVRDLLSILNEGPENWQVKVASGRILQSFGAALQQEAPALVTRMKDAFTTKDPGLYDLIGAVLLSTRPASEQDLSALFGPMRTSLELKRPEIFDDLAAALCGNRKVAVPALSKLLSITPEEEHVGIVGALCAFGRDSAPAGASLVELMKGPNRDRTVAIVRALPRIAGREATEPLIALLNSVNGVNPPEKRDRAMRMEILEALKNLGPDADSAVAGPVLERMLQSGEIRHWPENRDACAMSARAFLAVMGKEALPTLLKWFKSGDQRGLSMIGDLGPVAESATPELTAALASAKPQVHREIARALALIRPTNTPPRLAPVPPITCATGDKVDIPFTITDDDDSAEMLKITVIEKPPHGKFLDQKSPSVLTYQADSGKTGAVQFRVVAEDARSRSDAVTVQVTVTPKQ